MMNISKNISKMILNQRKNIDVSCFMGVFSALSDVYFFMKDKEGRFIGANQAQLKKLGLSSEEEILGKTDVDFFPTYMISHFAHDDTKVMTSGEPILDRVELVANPDGCIKWHVTSKFPIFDTEKKCLGIVGVMRDFEQSDDAWQPYRRLNDVVEYIKNNFSKNIEVGDLAKIANLSISQFERRFRKTFQQSPSKFLIQYRLTRASSILVGTENTLSKIALDVGFYDQSHFSREFQKFFGMAPGQYRKEHK
jgi:PAS domain S-box-containing protein